MNTAYINKDNFCDIGNRQVFGRVVNSLVGVIGNVVLDVVLTNSAGGSYL